MPCFYGFNKSLDTVPFSAGLKFSSVVKKLFPKEEP